MTSNLFLFLTALLATAAVSFTNAFSPTSIPRQQRRQSSMRISTARPMGLFDSFSKAFTNEEYGAPPDAIKVTARHILVPTIEEANTVLEAIGEGETSFAALAGRYSTCPSKSKGGSLGSFGPGTMVKEFDAVCFAADTKVGEIKGPIQTQFGYHLLVVDKRSGGGDWY
eukprot:CAMPEP_0201600686 /NCGR_PEP_ID=MMETSP0492-20130828/1693_1 /ASSEMBLY_ACC=CAM_ASM_000837 /TAXON_ID=420259 /ORGANISM="Thalassiosira gravida, Strain GMp14c1" /LENGTH=168 /DNA_ID=CAMNT_0048063519 /DNA_START=57 /DNA_END=563 /DNA_ORIENTATION=+